MSEDLGVAEEEEGGGELSEAAGDRERKLLAASSEECVRRSAAERHTLRYRHYFYFCTSKASKLSTQAFSPPAVRRV